MSSSKPKFHLQRVESDGSASPVEVYPVYALPADTQLSRRGLLGTGVTVASLLSMVSGAKAQQPRMPHSHRWPSGTTCMWPNSPAMPFAPR